MQWVTEVFPVLSWNCKLHPQAHSLCRHSSPSECLYSRWSNRIEWWPWLCNWNLPHHECLKQRLNYLHQGLLCFVLFFVRDPPRYWEQGRGGAKHSGRWGNTRSGSEPLPGTGLRRSPEGVAGSSTLDDLHLLHGYPAGQTWRNGHTSVTSQPGTSARGMIIPTNSFLMFNWYKPARISTISCIRELRTAFPNAPAASPTEPWKEAQESR